MTTYIQFDSLARDDAYFLDPTSGNYFPNDNYPNGGPLPPYTYYKQPTDKLIQSPSNYRVYYRELNSHVTKKTLEFRGHCKELPPYIQYEVEGCNLVIPGGALVRRGEGTATDPYTFTSVLNEPYLYVRIAPNDHLEKNKIVTNNPAGIGATFVMYNDRTQVGTDDIIPAPLPRPNNPLLFTDIDSARWIIYKTCMDTITRLDLSTADQWHIRIFDRYGNDIVISEDDNGGAGFTTPPAVDPDLQTMFLMGVKPKYPE